MSYLEKIEQLNNYKEEGKIPFLVDGIRYGQIQKVNLDIALSSNIFDYNNNSLKLKAHFDSFEAKNEAFEVLKNRLQELGIIRARDEKYGLVKSFTDKPKALYDRALSTFLGTLSFGQHINGYVKKQDGLYMWLGVRSKSKGYSGGMLDHIAAGGLPWGISLKENLAKECYEEAGISKELANSAKPTSIVSYWHEYELGGKEDIIFCYDLELKEDFKPFCTDGEVEKFILMPIKEVANIVKTQWRFKPNCNLVIIDFLVRWGYITPEDKDYIAIVKGLRR